MSLLKVRIKQNISLQKFENFVLCFYIFFKFKNEGNNVLAKIEISIASKEKLYFKFEILNKLYNILVFFLNFDKFVVMI